ncbi:zinc-binding protein A33-like isoform X2 [Stegostoma tigrinum]|uniref:zinc-binding protein A33-like isoform X2 n=1 Tax=Stegostoma tigrinum TaxID=3053191 RepID=UPI0028700652|nr:zinc-binding protein A33-like isoform X2 [Stegostoma tigrinum]
MASRKPSKDLTCSLCLSLFVEPVRLDCCHNFCKSCILKIWGKHRQVVSCPQCRVVLPRRGYTSNRTLSNLCEAARQLESNLKLGAELPGREEQGEKLNQGGEKDPSLCQEHGQKLVLFCEDDEILVCVNCVDSPPHSDHRFLPLEKPVRKYKEFTSSLEQDISAQFAKIHRYLEDKEKHLIEELRNLKEEDLQPIEESLKRIEEELTSLEGNIVKLGIHVEQQDGISFLKELKRLKERYLHKEDEEDEEDFSWSDEDNEIVIFPRRNYRRYYGPLLYSVWKELRQIISPFPASLTMDPDTAHRSLVLSEDLTSVTISPRKNLQLPDSTERFDQHPCVLGSQGFTSGKHYWEVEDQLNASLDSMEEEKKCKSELKQQQEGKISELDELSVSLEEDISTQFAKIRQYLDEKEKHLTEGLRRQKQADLRLMEENLKEIKVEIMSLDEKIGNLRADIEQQDGIAFLKELKRLQERYLDNEEEGDDEEEDSQSSEDEEILTFPREKYIAFQGPLLYTVWKEMKQIISPVPASLTLNPKTVDLNLVLSKDLTSVRAGNSTFMLPNNPQRFGAVPFVLGSQGFISGKHYWEVEVGDKTEWALGVAEESSSRKGSLHLGPEYGYWTVWLNSGNEYKTNDCPSAQLTPRVKPKIIGVYLDFEGGQVIFYNAADMSVIYTFIDIFTEKLFPVFYPGSSDIAPLVLRHFEL